MLIYELEISCCANTAEHKDCDLEAWLPIESIYRKPMIIIMEILNKHPRRLHGLLY